MKSKSFNFSEDTILKIFAIVFAFVLWVYVQAQEPIPLDTGLQTFKDVEVEWETDSSYTVTAITDQYVDISVRGVIDKINNLQDEDIRIKLDLRNYKDGKHKITLNPQLPRGIQLHSITPSTIDIVIDQWQSEERDVEIEYLNELPSELIIEEVIFEPKTVTVVGAKAYINNIKKVVVPYNLDLQGVSATDLKPEARDAYNKVVNGVSVKQNVSVNVKIKYRKWLPVKAMITGELPEGITYKLKPARIEVIGQKAELDVITELYTEEIDVSDVKAGDVLEVAVNYPNHLEPSVQEYKTVEITFE